MDDERRRAALKADVIETLGRLKDAGVIVDFDFIVGAGSEHLWIEHTAAALTAARSGRALLVDPALWSGVGTGREPRWLGPVLDATLADALAAEIEGRALADDDEP